MRKEFLRQRGCLVKDSEPRQNIVFQEAEKSYVMLASGVCVGQGMVEVEGRGILRVVWTGIGHSEL